MNPYFYYDPRYSHPIRGYSDDGYKRGCDKCRPKVSQRLIDDAVKLILEAGQLRLQREAAEHELASMPKQAPKPVKKGRNLLMAFDVTPAVRCSVKKKCFDSIDRTEVNADARGEQHNPTTCVMTANLKVGDVVKVKHEGAYRSGQVGKVISKRGDVHDVYFPSAVCRYETFYKPDDLVKVDPVELPSNTGLRVGDRVRVDRTRETYHYGEVACVTDIDASGDTVVISFLNPRFPTRWRIYGGNLTKLG